MTEYSTLPLVPISCDMVYSDYTSKGLSPWAYVCAVACAHMIVEGVPPGTLHKELHMWMYASVEHPHRCKHTRFVGESLFRNDASLEPRGGRSIRAMIESGTDSPGVGRNSSAPMWAELSPNRTKEGAKLDWQLDQALDIFFGSRPEAAEIGQAT